MTYGLETRLPAEKAPSPRRLGFGHWRSLDSRTRLQLIERELRPANDPIDDYPLAL